MLLLRFWLGLARPRTGVAFVPKVLFVCRSVYDVIYISCVARCCWFGLLTNYRLAKDRLPGVSLWQLSCDPDGRVALCFTFSREFRGCSGCMAGRNSGQASGSVEAEQDVRDRCLPWVGALSEIFMLNVGVVICGDFNGWCWFVHFTLALTVSGN